jgi:hypothetical protein
VTTGVLMGYPQTTSGVVSNTDGGFVVDNRFGNIYGVSLASNVGIRKWDAYPNGLELAARGLSALGVGGLYFYNAITYNSQQLVISSGASNSAQLYGFMLSDLTFGGQFGTISASLANSTALRILAPQQLCAFIDNHGRDVVVSCSLRDGSFTGGKEINCIGWPGGSNTATYCVENLAVIGARADGGATEAWAFGYATGTTGGQLYRIGSALGGFGIVASVGSKLLPATIDPTWTNITGVAGITVDETDGNLIMGFYTTDVVTNQARLVKLNKTTGAKMWSTAVGGSSSNIQYDSVDMAKNVVKNGTLYYLAASGILWTINTITGGATSATLDTLGMQSIGGHQMSEDISGSIFVYGTWSELGTHPAYFGNYCLTLGNHSGSHIGWRYWPSNTPTPPPTPGPPATSRKRAWSFVLDGHTFYVLDLGKQGTFVYDTTTSQWAQFITTGYNNWNFANGCMWGQRIVAGDLITTDVWEMNPGSLFDNGATTITHIVTGGIVTRNRVYHSVDSFSLACSVGQLQKQDGTATVLLSFSDDQGKTWTDMNTITLTQGDYGGEIAWNSLGSFESPGRIFKITDSGGFLRIDGADAGIDGFDAATADPGS